MKKFGNNPNNIKYIYPYLINKDICVTADGGRNEQQEFVSIMFYTIKRYEEGLLAHIYMHENGHVIDQTEKGCGFELMEDCAGKCIVFSSKIF